MNDPHHETEKQSMSSENKPPSSRADVGRGAMDPTGIDAYRPSEIAQRIAVAGIAKTKLPLLPLATLGCLAGVFIGFGALFYLAVLAGADAGHGPTRLLAGLAFSLGLILVVVGGAELFTGNALIVMAWVDGLVSGPALLRNWGLVYLANLLGALALCALVIMAGLHAGPVGAVAARITVAKFQLPALELLTLGVLCNALVCLAVWLSFAAHDVAGKILAIILPISAFVALGLEHSVANMFLLPFGLAAGAPGGAVDVVRNLGWVTLGNFIGGAGGVALSYWAAYRADASPPA